MRIQSHTRRLGLLSCVALLALACSPPKGVETSAPSPQKKSLDASEAKPRETQARAPRARAPRPIASAAPQDALHIMRTTGAVDGPIPYTIVAPAKAPEEAPLIIALHGRGDRAEGFSRLIERLRLPMRVIVGEAPMRWGMGSGKQWFEMKSTSRAAEVDQRIQDLRALSEKLKKRWPSSPKPMLLGFSQGAILALQAIAKEPEAFTAAVALSGALIEPEGLSASPVARPLLMSAGTRDRIISVDETQRGAEALKALGHRVDLFLFEGGHTIPKELVTKIQSFLRSLHPEAFSKGPKK